MYVSEGFIGLDNLLFNSLVFIKITFDFVDISQWK